MDGGRRPWWDGPMAPGLIAVGALWLGTALLLLVIFL